MLEKLVQKWEYATAWWGLYRANRWQRRAKNHVIKLNQRIVMTTDPILRSKLVAVRDGLVDMQIAMRKETKRYAKLMGRRVASHNV